MIRLSSFFRHLCFDIRHFWARRASPAAKWLLPTAISVTSSSPALRPPVGRAPSSRRTARSRAIGSHPRAHSRDRGEPRESDRRRRPRRWPLPSAAPDTCAPCRGWDRRRRADASWCAGRQHVASGSVKRVCVSNVRMPRSQSMTFGLPASRMYSAARSSSSIVALGPRFKQHRLVALADRFQQPVVLHVAGADLQARRHSGPRAPRPRWP